MDPSKCHDRLNQSTFVATSAIAALAGPGRSTAAAARGLTSIASDERDVDSSAERPNSSEQEKEGKRKAETIWRAIPSLNKHQREGQPPDLAHRLPSPLRHSAASSAKRPTPSATPSFMTIALLNSRARPNTRRRARHPVFASNQTRHQPPKGAPSVQPTNPPHVHRRRNRRTPRHRTIHRLRTHPQKRTHRNPHRQTMAHQPHNPRPDPRRVPATASKSGPSSTDGHPDRVTQSASAAERSSSRTSN